MGPSAAPLLRGPFSNLAVKVSSLLCIRNHKLLLSFLSLFSCPLRSYLNTRQSNAVDRLEFLRNMMLHERLASPILRQLSLSTPRKTKLEPSSSVLSWPPSS